MTRKSIPGGVEKDFRVVLPKKLLKAMQRLIKEGVYQSYAEIIREGIRLVVERHEKRHQYNLMPLNNSSQLVPLYNRPPIIMSLGVEKDG